VLIHHTDCGLEKISDDDFKFQIEREIGIRPSWAVEAFRDPYDDVRQSIARLAASPFVTHKQNIFGFVYEVDKHQLVRVDPYPS
ncbi:carbonic anhydrase, partial [mine drainage metagenome]